MQPHSWGPESDTNGDVQRVTALTAVQLGRVLGRLLQLGAFIG